MDHLVLQERNEAISTLSAIAYGFMGSQALFAALELGLFTALSDEPCGLDDLAKRLGAAMQEAGFAEVAIQPFLPDLTFLVSGHKP